MRPTPSLDDFRNEATARRNTMTDNLRAKQERFEEQHPGLMRALGDMSKWNDFAASLVDQFKRKGDLSERQIASAESMRDKLAQRELAKREQVRQQEMTAASNMGTVDMSAIRALFDTAQSNGLKRPKFFAGDVKISLAPSTGRNAGALYIVRDPDIYQGKIFGDEFQPGYNCAPDTLEVLQAIAKDPGEYARMTGKQTGRCCCCGRELTDPESIANGIGPICASNWGI